MFPSVSQAMLSRKRRACPVQTNEMRYGQGLYRSTLAGSVESAMATYALTSSLRAREVPVMQQTLARISYSVGQKIAQAVLNNRTSQESLVAIARILGEAFLAERCMIMPLPQQGSEVAYWSRQEETGQMQKPSDPTTFLLQHLLHLNEAASSVQPLVVDNLEATLQANPQADLPFSNHSNRLNHTDGLSETNSHQSSNPSEGSALSVRTLFQGNVNGLIVLTGSQPDQWRELEVHLLKNLAPQVAIAISQNQLEQRVQQQQQQQMLLDRLTSTIRNSGDLQEIFQLAVQNIPTSLQLDRGMVLLFKYADPLFKLRTQGVPKAKASVAAQWYQHPQWEIDERQSDSTAIGQETESEAFWIASCELCRHLLNRPADPVVVRSGRSVEDADCLLTLESTASVFQLDNFAASLVMPLENQGAVLGCLVFQQERARSWSSTEITFIRMVAAQLSTAIIQNRTLQQVQAMVQERTAQLQHSLEVQAKLYEKTRQQVEQLRRMNEEREEFLSTVSHELLTPLTSMTLAIRMLRQSSLSPERQAKYFDILEQQCNQETTLINDLLVLRQLEANQSKRKNLEFQKLDVRYWIQDVAKSIAATWTEDEVQLEIEVPSKPLLIQTDSDSLHRIMTELLMNAKKYSEPGSLIHLQILHQLNCGQGSVVVRLSNTGAGISPEELPHIFDKFRRGQGVTKQAIQGTGLGLALVKGLVEHLNGEITASSHMLGQSSLWQTCFTVTFPQCLQETVQVIS